MTLLGRFVGSEAKADEIRQLIAERRRQDSLRYRALLSPAKPEKPAPVIVKLHEPAPRRRRSVRQLAGRLLEHMTEDIINIVVTVMQEAKHGTEKPDGAGQSTAGDGAAKTEP